MNYQKIDPRLTAGLSEKSEHLLCFSIKKETTKEEREILNDIFPLPEKEDKRFFTGTLTNDQIDKISELSFVLRIEASIVYNPLH